VEAINPALRCAPRGRETTPLGLRPEVACALNRHQRSALERLAAFDLSRVRRRLEDDGPFPSAWIDEAILEFRRFMALKIVPGPAVTMSSPVVDEDWHTCILFTRLYADLCQHVFNEFVHHEPNDGDDPGTGSVLTFQQRYQDTFGVLTRMWKYPLTIPLRPGGPAS
jgi:hypothetical protein